MMIRVYSDTSTFYSEARIHNPALAKAVVRFYASDSFWRRLSKGQYNFAWLTLKVLICNV
jgi:hypothetical protein